MATCYCNSPQFNDFTKKFTEQFMLVGSPEEADVQLTVTPSKRDKYNAEIIQGAKKHLEYHWIDGNYYTLWYDDDIEGFRFRSDGTILPESKDFFYALIENEVQDTPAKCGYHMGVSLSLMITANKQSRKD